MIDIVKLAVFQLRAGIANKFVREMDKDGRFYSLYRLCGDVIEDMNWSNEYLEWLDKNIK